MVLKVLNQKVQKLMHKVHNVKMYAIYYKSVLLCKFRLEKSAHNFMSVSGIETPRNDSANLESHKP